MGYILSNIKPGQQGDSTAKDAQAGIE